MDIQRIQEMINQTAALEKTMTLHQIGNRIEAACRKDDPGFKERCSAAQYLYYNKDNSKREKMSEHFSKPVNTPWGEFKSQKSFNEFIRKEFPDIKIKFRDKRISMPHLYYDIKDGPGEVTTENVMYTPYGYTALVKNPFCSRHELHERAKKSGCSEALKNNTASSASGDWFKKMSYRYPDQYYIKTEPKREWLLEQNQ